MIPVVPRPLGVIRGTNSLNGSSAGSSAPAVVFLSKRKREELKKEESKAARLAAREKEEEFVKRRRHFIDPDNQTFHGHRGTGSHRGGPPRDYRGHYRDSTEDRISGATRDGRSTGDVADQGSHGNARPANREAASRDSTQATTRSDDRGPDRSNRGGDEGGSRGHDRRDRRGADGGQTSRRVDFERGEYDRRDHHRAGGKQWGPEGRRSDPDGSSRGEDRDREEDSRGTGSNRVAIGSNEEAIERGLPAGQPRRSQNHEEEEASEVEEIVDDSDGRRSEKDEGVNSASDRTEGGGNTEVPSVAELSLRDLDLLSTGSTEMRGRQQVKELEQIREHYLGLRKERKKMQKPSEKFRNIFNFEWDAIEDTARGDNNSLYLHRVEPQLLFGRGFRAGIDIREQRKANNFYDELVKRRREVVGRLTGNEEAMEDVQADAAQKRGMLTKSRDMEDSNPSRRHWTNKSREEMTDRDWRIFREDFEIYIKGGRVPPPIRMWKESGLPSELLEAVDVAGYEKPTPIQMQAIPIALEQRDLIGIAETGSGKTAAFVLPMLSYVKSLPPLNDETSQDGPYALVLAPSRELAIQIEEETRKFASFCKCRAVAVVGGRNAELQAFELRRGAEVVIGTPGRTKDCLEKSFTVLSQCNYVVLDEADRMIDMGFEEIVNWILDQIPSTNLKSEDENQALQQELEAKAGYRRYRLTHLFSATMPPALEKLASKYLRAPSYISIGDPGAGKRSIEQRLEFMPEGKKKQRLHEVLMDAEPPVMVFVNQKKIADMLAKTLQKMNFRAGALHGGKAQENREASLQEFKDGEVDVLVATDVAGRGIDVEGVQLVLNFDMPKDIESYMHRIGRTGRAGKKGRAVSFVTEDDSAIFYDLKQLLITTNNVVPLELNQHPASKVKPGGTAAAGGSTGKNRPAANTVVQ